MMMDGDFETTTWRDLFEGSEDIDNCKDELQRIAILYSRCGSNRHQECWHQVDSDLQYEERVKISKIKRGGLKPINHVLCNQMMMKLLSHWDRVHLGGWIKSYLISTRMEP